MSWGFEGGGRGHSRDWAMLVMGKALGTFFGDGESPGGVFCSRPDRLQSL